MCLPMQFVQAMTQGFLQEHRLLTLGSFAVTLHWQQMTFSKNRVEHQRLFELVVRADLCGPTPTLVDPGIVDRESPIGKSVDGRVMGGNK